MSKPVEMSDLDATDLSELLTELTGAPVKVRNPTKAREQLATVLTEQKKILLTNDDGNFEIVDAPKPKAAKAAPPPPPAKKTKGAAPPPPPEEEEEEEEEEDEEEEEEEIEDEEEEVVVAPPAKKGKAVAAPAAADKPKRTAPASREPTVKGGKITILVKDKTFKADSIRDILWGVMTKAKTVEAYFAAAGETSAASTGRGFLNVAVKEGWISVA